MNRIHLLIIFLFALLFLQSCRIKKLEENQYKLAQIVKNQNICIEIIKDEIYKEKEKDEE